MTLQNKVIVISGGSRGIGLEIALRIAKGNKIALLAKTAEPHPNLPGTIYTAAKEIEERGGEALPLVCDIRSADRVSECISKVVDKWGQIDVVINNASAISLTGTEQTSVKKYDLMQTVNGRGTWVLTKACLPYLKKSSFAHVLNISPPLVMDRKWFQNHTAYSLAKYGMSIHAHGWAGEFKKYGICVNCLWPKCSVDTAALKMIGSNQITRQSVKPEMMADAAYEILSRRETGQFFIDDEVLLRHGKAKNWDELAERYAVTPGVKKFIPDFFLPETVDTSMFITGKLISKL